MVSYNFLRSHSKSFVTFEILMFLFRKFAEERLCFLCKFRTNIMFLSPSLYIKFCIWHLFSQKSVSPSIRVFAAVMCFFFTFFRNFRFKKLEYFISLCLRPILVFFTYLSLTVSYHRRKFFYSKKYLGPKLIRVYS